MSKLHVSVLFRGEKTSFLRKSNKTYISRSRVTISSLPLPEFRRYWSKAYSLISTVRFRISYRRYGREHESFLMHGPLLVVISAQL